MYIIFLISDPVLPPSAKTRVKDPLPFYRFSSPFFYKVIYHRFKIIVKHSYLQCISVGSILSINQGFFLNGH